MSHKGSNLKFCSCPMCRYGRKRWGNQKMITNLKRTFRHKCNQELHLLKYDVDRDVPEKISVPYTD